ncbi:MAG TPA: adenylate/guanylate cyclase domain-containing protein [Myxococcales bacterium]|nr:adenylate/guanylate cyclase domain-containing protein [Myxococcales bacterium]
MRLKVRTKLILLVAICTLPGVLAALRSAQVAYQELVRQVSQRMELASRAFKGDLQEDVEGSRRTLRVAGADPRLLRDLEVDDEADARKLLASLGSGVDDSAFVLVDDEGHLVGASTGLGAHLATEATLEELMPVLRGTSLALLPLTLSGRRLYSVVVAEPVMGAERRLGTLVLARPLDAEYLEHLESRVGGDWMVRINGALVASTPDHPEPELERTLMEGLDIARDGDRYYALKTFRPEPFQRPGQVTEVTVSQDVTRMRARTNTQLAVGIGVLGAFMALAGLMALFISNRMVRGLERIGAAAASLKAGTYRTADDVRTGDELEALAQAFNQAIQGLKERDQLKDAFGKYANRHVVELVTQGKKIELGGETIPVTVFFADIRGFTTISEKMEPKALLDFLNLYFREMVDCVISEGGAVDKYIGDAIMAVFGAPVPQSDDALRAVRAALRMRERLSALNARFAERQLPQIRFGLGIHSGTVVAGHMGHSERLEYTVIGDPVNVASRLESMTKELKVDILLSEDTYLKVRDRVEAEPLQRMAVRGRAQEILVYRVTRLLEPEATAAA